MDFFKTPTKPPVVVTEDPSTGQPMVTVAKEEAPEAGASTPAAATTEKTTLAAPVAATTPKAVAVAAASKTTEAKVITNEKKYGDYPFIDFFINAQIKTVRVFIKVDHLNSGMMGNYYILTPRYPMNDRALKLGVSWRFFD